VKRPADGAKRLVGGDLRAALWAASAIVAATLAIFVAQQLHAGEGTPRNPGRAAPTVPASPTGSHSNHPGCTASYTVAGAWPAGFQANVTIRTNGSSSINGWVVKWTFPADQTVMQLWNGHYTQTKTAVTVRSEGWYPSPASNEMTTTFGFVGTGAAPPAVQDLTCTVSVGAQSSASPSAVAPSPAASPSPAPSPS
jgi:hypothetical protein